MSALLPTRSVRIRSTRSGSCGNCRSGSGGSFLSQYREALDGARDPGVWKQPRRVLQPLSWMVIAASQPGHYEARVQALAGTGEGMLLDE